MQQKTNVNKKKLYRSQTMLGVLIWYWIVTERGDSWEILRISIVSSPNIVYNLFHVHFQDEEYNYFLLETNSFSTLNLRSNEGVHDAYATRLPSVFSISPWFPLSHIEYICNQFFFPSTHRQQLVIRHWIVIILWLSHFMWNSNDNWNWTRTELDSIRVFFSLWLLHANASMHNGIFCCAFMPIQWNYLNT